MLQLARTGSIVTKVCILTLSRTNLLATAIVAAPPVLYPINTIFRFLPSDSFLLHYKLSPELHGYTSVHPSG